MLINVVATALVAHGILSIESKDTFVQLATDTIASVITMSVSIYSIYKMVELHKHKLSINSTSVKNQETTLPANQQTGNSGEVQVNHQNIQGLAQPAQNISNQPR